MNLQIDPEFKSLIPPLMPEEYDQLRASLLAEGCRDALVIWNNTIVDGHNRYELCQELGISFQTVNREFASRDHAIVWIAENQLARRNIAQIVRDWLVSDTLKPALERIGRTHKSIAKTKEDLPDSSKSFEPHRTDQELAKSAGTSEQGIRQSAFVKREAPDVVKKAAVEQDISRNRAYEIARRLKSLPAEYHDICAALCIGHEDKVDILIDLYKSAGSPETNGTFFEIISTGGFHYGDDMEKWCDFANSKPKAIREALKSLAKHHARERLMQRHIEAGQLPEAIFDLIYCDPPWRYEHSISDSRKIENHYPTMQLEDICALPVQRISADNCTLYMWATNPKLAEAFRVIDAWGFTYRTNAVWVKDKIGMGYYFRQRHELLLVATKGEPPVPPTNARQDSVIEQPRQKHSAKPHVVYAYLESMYPHAKKVELFARSLREGWEGWGNDAVNA